MEFEEQDQEQNEEMQQLASSNYVSTAAAEASRTRAGGYKYKECLKNQAIGIGGNAVDGCREFMPASWTRRNPRCPQMRSLYLSQKLSPQTKRGRDNAAAVPPSIGVPSDPDEPAEASGGAVGDGSRNGKP